LSVAVWYNVINKTLVDIFFSGDFICFIFFFVTLWESCTSPDAIERGN
jgi:hypothetical protein